MTFTGLPNLSLSTFLHYSTEQFTYKIFPGSVPGGTERLRRSVPRTLEVFPERKERIHGRLWFRRPLELNFKVKFI